MSKSGIIQVIKMGTFDTFIFTRKCPECSSILGEWQTKELVNQLREWRIGEAVHQAPKNCDIECHDWCHSCKKMIYAWAIVKDGIYSNHIIPPKDEEVSGIRVKVNG